MAFRIPGVWGSNPNSLAKPKISRDLETSIKGVFVAGDLGGSPVIRTAVNQGVHVARTVQTRCGGGGAADGTFDLVIVGAGAAGLSASLEAKRLGLTCVLLEKREWAATIQDFSKGKQVFAEGWLRGSRVIGRPVDIKELPDGSLLVSDDFADAVYRIRWRAPGKK
ncbi:MAG: NAD(P)-binding domain-containing protein [Rhodospirillales bacterium]|nr:NAD(P)-binding domain-containing protein [Rhodospirillales bacterium]